MKVYVSTVYTRRDTIIAVGATRKEAIQAAGQRTFDWLTKNGADMEDRDTVKKCIEYYDGMEPVEIEVGKAIVYGYEG